MLSLEFLLAVRALDAAFAKLDEVWDEKHDELCKAYPFDSSFDELAVEVGNWRDEVEALCKKEEESK